MILTLKKNGVKTPLTVPLILLIAERETWMETTPCLVDSSTNGSHLPLEFYQLISGWGGSCAIQGASTFFSKGFRCPVSHLVMSQTWPKHGAPVRGGRASLRHSGADYSIAAACLYSGVCEEWMHLHSCCSAVVCSVGKSLVISIGFIGAHDDSENWKFSAGCNSCLHVSQNHRTGQVPRYWVHRRWMKRLWAQK